MQTYRENFVKSIAQMCLLFAKNNPSLLQDVIHELAKKLGYRSRDIGET